MDSNQSSVAYTEATKAASGLYGAEHASELTSLQLFSALPANIADAHLWAGMYLAEAGRLIGGVAGMSLGAQALAEVSRSSMWGYAPITISTGMASTMDAAAAAIQAAAGGNSEALSLANRLQSYSQQAETAAYANSPMGKIASWAETAATIVKVVIGGALLAGAFGIAYYVYRYWKK